MNNLNMYHESALRQLKCSLDQMIVDKENNVHILQKKLTKANTQRNENIYSNLVKLYDGEERKIDELDKLKDRTIKLKNSRELLDQKADRDLARLYEKTEDKIYSLESRIKDKNEMTEIFKSREKTYDMEERRQFDNTQEKLKSLRRKKFQIIDDQQKKDYEEKMILDVMKSDVNNEKIESKKLLKSFNQVEVLSQIEKAQDEKITAENLRKEAEIIEVDIQERMKDETKRINKENEKKLIKDERDSQINEKERLKLEQKEREKHYVDLLTELLAEENKSAVLKSKDRARQLMSFRASAQLVLEGRKKRREKDSLEKLIEIEKEHEYGKLRDQIKQEEEKKLLLQYLPHLSHLLSTNVIRELALL